MLRGAGIDTQRINLGRLIPSFCLLLRRFFLRRYRTTHGAEPRLDSTTLEVRY